jgi:mRNA interferase RelE/StbE
MYNTIFSKQAESFLDKLENSDRERIVKTLDRIKIRPERFLEKLIGEEGYKFRIGDFRLFIDLDKGNLLISVIKIGYRKNIYKN